jgi:hypothetical protein
MNNEKQSEQVEAPPEISTLLPVDDKTLWRDAGRFIPSYNEERDEYAHRRSILRDNVIVADAYGERAAKIICDSVNVRADRGDDSRVRERLHQLADWIDPRKDPAPGGVSWLDVVTSLREIADGLDCSVGQNSCWHCGVVLARVPKLRCEQCPDECDVEGCTELGCTAPSPPSTEQENPK